MPRCWPTSTAGRVALLRADWTRRDAAISAELARLGRNGVPVYAIYKPGQALPTLVARTADPASAARCAGGALMLYVARPKE